MWPLSMRVGPDEAPGNSFVASFLGESNFLDGRVIELRETTCMVRTDTGIHVEVTCTARVAPGDRVRVSIRPEKIRLGDSHGLVRNCYDGIVDEVIYVGNATKYRVRVHQSLDLTVRTAQKQAAKGDRLRLSWEPNDAILLHAAVEGEIELKSQKAE